MSYTSLAPTYGLAIDWETSGSDFETNDSAKYFQGLSFGAVIYETRTLKPVDTLYREIKFDANNYQWSMEAQAIHGLTREHLEINGISQEEAACDLMELLLKWMGPDPTIMFLGHNVHYDIQFTKQLFNLFDIPFKEHNVKLDTAGIAFINFGTYKSDHLFEIMGMPKRNKHNALDDALMTLEVAKNLKHIMQEILNG
jgi:DNA polymerase III epsilon subunit-like protein